MTEFREQDLTGARFEHVSLRGATFTKVKLNDANMRAVDFSGAQVRGALFHGTRMRGVELGEVEITGELQNVVVNGVDIAPPVEAELNRRMPERARTVRRERQAMMRQVMESLTDEQLATDLTRTGPAGPGLRTSPSRNVSASSSTRMGAPALRRT